MVNINKKSAFTIAEVLISMFILAIILGLAMKVFTKKHAKPIYNPTHGYIMCYRDISNGKVYRKVGASKEVEQTGKNYCDFTPIKTANYYTIYAVGGGGGGATSTYGGAPAEFLTLFVTNIADSLKLYPGAGGNVGENGGETRIENNSDNASERKLLSVRGGLAGGINTLQQGFIRACEVVPLASLLKSSDKSYFDNNQGDKATCEVRHDGLYASLCPHTLDDIKQQPQITSFFSDYAETMYYAAGPYSYWYNDPGKYSKKFLYDPVTDGKKCMVYPSKARRYCLEEDGDRLYECGGNMNDGKCSTEWYLVGATQGNKPVCKTDSVQYTDPVMKVNNATDSYIMRRSHNNFKYMLDLHYDMTTRNTTKFIIPSGFGEYIESSSLKDESTAVLFRKSAEWRAKTSDTASKRFDPSQGDGGYVGEPGLPGAVFIAW